MADERKHWVDGNMRVCEMYFMAYVIRLLCSSSSLTHWKQLSMCHLNALSDKTQTVWRVVPTRRT